LKNLSLNSREKRQDRFHRRFLRGEIGVKNPRRPRLFHKFVLYVRDTFLHSNHYVIAYDLKE
jgi:hypothetical protein